MEKNINQEIEKLEDELWQAEKRLDVDALDRIYADDIMVTAPIGIVVDKPAVMTEVRNAWLACPADSSGRRAVSRPEPFRCEQELIREAKLLPKNAHTPRRALKPSLLGQR
jgi:hypothetical protein